MVTHPSFYGPPLERNYTYTHTDTQSGFCDIVHSSHPSFISRTDIYSSSGSCNYSREGAELKFNVMTIARNFDGPLGIENLFLTGVAESEEVGLELPVVIMPLRATEKENRAEMPICAGHVWKPELSHV